MTDDPFADVLNARFRARLDSLSPRPLVVGFSGGGDSLYLLLQACAFGRRTGRRVVALTVDHGLQPDSAAWTRAAGAAATALGAEWRALVWEGVKPATGLPSAARQARHRLLARGARSVGARVILLGHTADDLAESALMRQAEASSLPDPREWSPSPVWPEGRDLFLFRPLLSLRRTALREDLAARGLTWLDDPANDDLRFARARARQALRRGAEIAPLPLRMSADAPRARLARQITCTAEGHAVFDRALLRETPAEVLHPVLGAAVLSIGGGRVPPGRAALDRLVTALGGTGPRRTQLAGVRLAADEARVLLARDARDQRRRPAPGGEGVFDNRFEIDPEAAVGFLAGQSARLSWEDRRRLKAIPALARPALPVLDPDGATPMLPAPIGVAQPAVRALAPGRFAAACGLVACEAEIG